MIAFRYRGLDASGRMQRGLAYAVDSAQLRDQLVERKLHPLSITPVRFLLRRPLGLSERDASRLARDLGQLTASGMALAPALSMIAARETPGVAAIAREVRQRLAHGEPLSVALRAAQGRASGFLQALARGGEASGRQSDVLIAGAAALAASDTLKRRLITLSIYPAFIILVAVGAIAVYAYAVLPALAPAFGTLGDEVPQQTKLVLDAGAFIRLALPVVAGLVLATGLAAGVVPKFRLALRDGLIGLLMRGKRSPLRDFLFASLSGRLAVLIRAGVPLSVAWRLAREPIGAVRVQKLLALQDERIMEGVRLSEAIAALSLAPPDLVHYVAMGEQSGQIAKALDDAAEALGFRAQERIERLLSVITPLVIVTVGLLVGLITMMVFQGLLAIGDAVG